MRNHNILPQRALNKRPYVILGTFPDNYTLLHKNTACGNPQAVFQFLLFCRNHVVVNRLTTEEQIDVRFGADFLKQVCSLLRVLSFTSAP